MASTVPPPRIGLPETFSDLADLVERASTDLDEVLTRLAGLRAHDVSDHAIALGLLATVPEVDPPLAGRLHARPDDREARTLHVARSLRTAWDVRGHAAGDEVDPERFTLFYDTLAAAERELLRLCAEDPTDAAAWALRLSTARGLVLGASESRRRYERLRAVAPHPVAAQREYLQQLTPKWGGSWEDVEAFVDVVVAAAAPGSAEHALVPHAHLTRWVDEHRHEGTARLAAPRVVEALEAAADAYLAAPCPSRYAWLAAESDFAVALGLAGRRGRAADHFERLGGAIDAEVWSLVRDHHDDLERIRTAAQAKGRRR